VVSIWFLFFSSKEESDESRIYYRFNRRTFLFLISDFHRDVNKTCALSECYAACNSSSVPTFRVNISVPSSRVQQSKKNENFLEWNFLGLLYPWRGDWYVDPKRRNYSTPSKATNIPQIESLAQVYISFITALQTSFEITISPSQIGFRTRGNCACLESEGYCTGDAAGGGDGNDNSVDCSTVAIQKGVIKTHLSKKSFRENQNDDWKITGLEKITVNELIINIRVQVQPRTGHEGLEGE